MLFIARRMRWRNSSPNPSISPREVAPENRDIIVALTSDEERIDVPEIAFQVSPYGPAYKARING
jgi:hypothetical protein